MFFSFYLLCCYIHCKRLHFSLAFFLHPMMVLLLLVQTDMMDLLGSDLPVESDDGMKFAWSDGILLQV